jgi:glycerate dehydrogenase
MHIVILDGHTLNPGDQDWDGVKKLGDVTLYDRTTVEETVSRCEDADVILTNKAPIGKDVLLQLPKLKYIGVTATGYNMVDVDFAREKGIVVTNVPAYGTDSVAQMTFALLLELCLHVSRHSDAVMDGKWSRSPDFCFWDFPLVELAGKTMGIIGYGAIGIKVGEMAAAFGMNVLGSARRKTDQSQRSYFQWAELDALLERSDVVSIHCPLTPETKGLINEARLRQMKRSAFLLNTSRGPIITEGDLAAALTNGVIAGAGLDVLSIEPPSPDNPLFKAPNCIITPHIAWATREARQRLMGTTVSNLESFVAGKTVNQVNK